MTFSSFLAAQAKFLKCPRLLFFFLSQSTCNLSAKPACLTLSIFPELATFSLPCLYSSYHNSFPENNSLAGLLLPALYCFIITQHLGVPVFKYIWNCNILLNITQGLLISFKVKSLQWALSHATIQLPVLLRSQSYQPCPSSLL